MGLLAKGSPDPENTIQREIIKENLHEHVQIYTDGSKTQVGNFVGYAVVIPSMNHEIQHKISSFASIYTAESLAILTALRTISTLKINKSLILTDSLSVLSSIEHFPSRNSTHIIYQIMQLWDSLNSNGVESIFIWSPAHILIQGNEKADELAKQAISMGIPQSPGIPHSDFKESIDRRMKDCTAKTLRLQAKKKGSYYFSNFYKGWKPPWFQKLKIDRPHITTISRMRSNHFNLNESLARNDIIYSPLCDCNQIESLSHVFWECLKYNKERASLLKALKKLKISSLNITHLINSPTEKICYLLFNFLKSINKNI